MGQDFPSIVGFEIVKQGAEARLYKGTYLGRPALIKERFVKRYRHPDLDTLLTKERTKGESRAIVRAKAAGNALMIETHFENTFPDTQRIIDVYEKYFENRCGMYRNIRIKYQRATLLTELLLHVEPRDYSCVRTPALFLVDFDRRRIYMEYIDDAMTLKDFIDANVSERENVEHLITHIANQIGSAVARLHSKNIIHGDLTTSNMLLQNSESQNKEEVRGNIILIDFGLAHVESTAEDKAVDIYVLERALLSAHSEVPTLFPEILKSYEKSCTSKDKREVMIKYREVQARGRKRLMVG